MCAQSPTSNILLSQDTFGAKKELPGNKGYGLGGGATSNQIIVLGDKFHFTPKSQLRAQGPLPADYQLLTGKGKVVLVPDAENFRFSFSASDSSHPVLLFRFRDELEHYRIDVKEGKLIKVSNGVETVLAESKIPLFDQSTGGENWSSFELVAKGNVINLSVSTKGKPLESAFEIADPEPFDVGSIIVGTSKVEPGHFAAFGDLLVERLPDSPKAKATLKTQDPMEMSDAIRTTMESLKRDPRNKQFKARQKAMRTLRSVNEPASQEVQTALAVAVCDPDLWIRLSALRTIKALNLQLDVPQLLLDGLTSKDPATRRGAMASIINIQLPPEKIQARVADALMQEDRLIRKDIKLLCKDRLEKKQVIPSPYSEAVFQEVKNRLTSSRDLQTRIALIRALGRDCDWEKPLPGTLPVLADCLQDPSPEVRLAALRSIRYLESPLVLNRDPRKIPLPNMFLDNPELTASIVQSLDAILKNDASPACRMEAVGCLTEIRQSPDSVIAALNDADSGVRSMAAQGLCNFPRSAIESATPRLKELLGDTGCKADAEAVLGYLEDKNVEAASASAAQSATVLDLEKMTPEEVLAKTKDLAAAGAQLSLLTQAERIPFPDDIISHSSAQLIFKRNRTAANERIQEALRLHSYGDLAGLGAPLIPAVYALHYSKSRYYPGGLTAETEALFKEMMFSIVDWPSRILFDECLKNIMRLPGTENQSLNYRFGLWFLCLGLLNEDPAYSQRMLRSGKTVAEYYDAWNKFMQDWLRTRALTGFWIELGSNYASQYSLPAIFAFYVAATDPETRNLAKMFLDLSFIDGAQCSYGDLRGGSKNRIKSRKIYPSMSMAHSLLYDGKAVEQKGSHLLAVSGYQAPPAAVLLRRYEQYPKSPIEIANRRLGEVHEGKKIKPNAKEEEESVPEAPAQAAKGSRKNDEEDEEEEEEEDDTIVDHVSDSHMINYIWKTRHYMMGSALRPPGLKYSPLYNNCPFNGVLFPDSTGVYHNFVNFYTFQHRNVMLVELEKDFKEPFTILVPPKAQRVEQNGWTFIDKGNAYVGIKVLRGPSKWDESLHAVVPEDQFAPVLIQAGDVDEFGSFEGFIKALEQNSITVTQEKVDYKGPKQPHIEFFAPATGQVSRVEGKPFDPKPRQVYSSPFMTLTDGENQVKVQVGSASAIYDFANGIVK